MKIILSRKGTDSSAGGIPGIILPNNRIVHIPIPGDNFETTTYSDVKCNDGSLAELISDLTTSIWDGKSKRIFADDIKCHLDPDLNESVYPRAKDWRGCFGQIGAAQTVLAHSNVEKGDIFIFFGWFNKTYYENNKLKYYKGEGFHMIYGWMQIEDIIYTSNTEVPDWLSYHSHVNENMKNNPSNCIYIGSHRLSWNKNIKGYGVFEYFDDSLVLTKEGMTRSKWSLPEIFRDVSITYHNQNSWREGYFQSAFRGQEFVCQESKAINQWVKELIENNVIHTNAMEENPDSPKVITMCGSLKFKHEMIEIALEMEFAGNVVLTPVFSMDGKDKLSKEDLDILGKMHKEKIKISDAILVVDINGYIGESTRSEIEFAKSLNKEIIYTTEFYK